MRRLALLLSLSLAGSAGCFVMEELDQGAELIERHGSRDGGDANSAVSTAPPDPSLYERATSAAQQVQSWWQEARAPEPPSNPVIECHLEGSRAFTTESDCLSRGGWVRPGTAS